MPSMIVILFIPFIIVQSNTNQNQFIKQVRSNYFVSDIQMKDKIFTESNSISFNNYLLQKINPEEIRNPLEIDFSNLKEIRIKKTAFQLENKEYESEREKLQNVIAIFLATWSEFFVKKQIPDSAMNFNFTESKDRIFFSYITANDGKFARVSKAFSKDGILQTITIQSDKDYRITIKPNFEKIGDKYVCKGWLYQKLTNQNAITEGIEVMMSHLQIGKNFYPLDVQIKIRQTNQSFYAMERIVFRNYKKNNIPVE